MVRFTTRAAALVLALAGCDVRLQFGAQADAGVDAGGGPACVALGAVPTWRQGLPVGAWVRVPGTSLDGVAPVPVPAGSAAQRLEGPAGLAADTTNDALYLAASGGNGDYAGNEVYRIALSDEAPRWAIVSPPSSPASIRPDASHAADGRPSAAWGYYSTWFIEPLSRLLRFSATGVWGSGATFGTIDGWDVASSAWVPAGTYPSYPGSATFEMPTTKDFSSGDVYQLQGDNHLYRWHRATNALEDLGAPTVGQGSFYELDGSPMVFDPTTQRLVLLLDRSGQALVRVWNLRTRVWSQLPLRGAEVQTALPQLRKAMAFFDPCWSRIVVKGTDPNRLWLVDPETFELVSWPTTGELPPEPLAGVHTLFQWLPRLGGYAFTPRTGSGVYFLPTAASVQP